MSASFADIVAWLVPLLFGGLVSVYGLLVLLIGRFNSGSGWEVRGPVTVIPALLALPTLPLVFLINPSLAQRTAWTAEAEERHRRSQERQERKKVIAERDREIAGRLADLDKERVKDPARLLEHRSEYEQLQQERRALSKENLALTDEDRRDSLQVASVGRGGPRDPMPYLLPLGWGAALYGVGWLFGRNRPAAKQTATAAPTPAPAEPVQDGPCKETEHLG